MADRVRLGGHGFARLIHDWGSRALVSLVLAALTSVAAGKIPERAFAGHPSAAGALRLAVVFLGVDLWVCYLAVERRFQRRQRRSSAVLWRRGRDG